MRESSFKKNVLTLLTGTTVAQAIPIAISPILTRMYSPEEFGILAIFVSIVTIFSVLVTGSYDMAIILPKKDIDALHILKLSMIITISVSLFLFCIIFIFNQQLTDLIGTKDIALWLYFTPFAILLTGIYQNFNYWLNRQQYYKEIALSRVSQSFGTGLVQLGMGIFGFLSSGLIIGRIIGQIVATIIVSKIYFNKREYYQKKKLKLIALAKRYKKFPLFESWSNMLNTSSTEVPVIMISSFFSPTMSGFYSIANRMLLLPMSLVGSSIGQVFLQKASSIKNDQSQLTDLTWNIYKKLLLIGVIPISIIIIYADIIFTFIFGSNWHIAGEFAQILGIWILFVFITSPLSMLVIVKEKQKEALFFNVFIFLSRIASIIVGYNVFSNIYYTLGLFAITGVLFWVFWFCYILKLVNIRPIVAIIELLKYFLPSISILYLIRIV